MNGKTSKLVRRVMAHLRAAGKAPKGGLRELKSAAVDGAHRDRGRRRNAWRRQIGES